MWNEGLVDLISEKEPPDYDTIFDDSFLQAVITINNDIISLVCRKNEGFINHSLINQDDIKLLSRSCNYECRQKKVSSLNKLKKELESLQCFHTFLCLHILEILKYDIRTKNLNPYHIFKINYQHVSNYVIRIISFFTYGKFVVNPWQYNFAKRVIDIARLNQQKKDTFEISLEYLDNTALLSSMNEFCDNCKNTNEFWKLFTSFTFNTFQKKSNQFSNRKNVKLYVKNLLSKINIPCVIKMDNISHILVNKANQKEEVIDSDYENKKIDFLQSLKLSKFNVETFEKNSIRFFKKDLLLKECRKHLSASNFHRACKFKQTSSKEAIIKLVMGIRSKKSEVTETKNNHPCAIKYGNVNEKKAKELFEKTMDVQIESCAAFVDEHLNYLTARPDGLIGKDGIVEIKCPFNAQEMFPEDAIKNNLIKFVHYNNNGDLVLKRTSHNFYQIQGELHITKRQYCYLIIWTPKGLVYCKILRDDKFWNDNMEKKLIDFYENIMLPEIINS
ncbi:protein PFC0760c-like [Daktulosphaira vitifoliae]|uniref:protein PFC0760c-like n=1 Tax=Daktulosphaira vitifoliae TaxID=58002 RepID=UPI0021A9910D|nr:protein PFC0760c-like [Daktulosphaira vitifoliae]